MQPHATERTFAAPLPFDADPALPVDTGFAPACRALLPAGASPRLLVVIDAEEEFDWSGDFSRSATNVTAMAHQGPGQALLARHGVVPTYAIDFPVASQPDGYAPLLDWVRDGLCEIGSHLHTWVTPPFDEPLTQRNTYAGNLPSALEAAKLQTLTEQIETSFGVRPRFYRAGRYGIGPNTAATLARLGYLVDSSTVPYHDMRNKGGPDFREFRPYPYWFGPDQRLLELPVTAGLAGPLGTRAPWLHDFAEHHDLGRRLHFGSVLARTGALMRVRLTPEGVPVNEAIAATRDMYRQGLRVFTLSWHSPSLVPGHTPYVRNQNDLSLFLDWLRRYFDFFFGELGGRPTTPLRLRDELLHGHAVSA